MKNKVLPYLTLLHRLVLSTEPGTVQTRTGKVDPARKFKRILHNGQNSTLSQMGKRRYLSNYCSDKTLRVLLRIGPSTL